MSSLSPRTGLALMADGDFVNPNATDTNSAKMDLITSIQQCTSATRPSSPFDGQWIYETDTKTVRRWSAAESTWQYGASSIQRGYTFNTYTNTAAATVAGTAGGATTSAVSFLDFNMAVTGGRLYKIIEQGWFKMSGTPQQTSDTPLGIELFAQMSFANPPLGDDGYAKSYMVDYLQPSFMPAARSYYRVTYYVAPNGQATMYYRSNMRVNASGFPATITIGKPSDVNFPVQAWVYDMGVPGSN